MGSGPYIHGAFCKGGTRTTFSRARLRFEISASQMYLYRAIINHCHENKWTHLSLYHESKWTDRIKFFAAGAPGRLLRAPDCDPKYLSIRCICTRQLSIGTTKVNGLILACTTKVNGRILVCTTEVNRPLFLQGHPDDFFVRQIATRNICRLNIWYRAIIN